MAGNYTVVVDGQKFSVQVAEGNADIKIEPAQESKSNSSETPAPASAPAGGSEVKSSVAGNVWKIVKNVGDEVKEGDVVMILEAMKMEIDIEAPCDGKIASIVVKPNDSVEEGQVLATIN